MPEELNMALVTWNCGNEKDDNDAAQKIAESWKKDFDPDVIAVALQEAKEPYVGDLMAGNVLKNYEILDEKSMWGITKLKEGLTHIQMAVLVKKEKRGEFSDPRTKLAKTFGKCKGGVCIAFTYRGKSFGIAGAHLDASSDKQRATEVDSIVKVLKSLGATFMFIAGDLNYRLKLDGKILTKSTKIIDFCKMLLDDKKRAEIFGNCDVLQTSGVAKAGFRCPPPMAKGRIMFPTYKKAPRVPSLYADADELAKLYFAGVDPESTIESKKKGREGTAECGWLDRVGYSVASGGGFKFKAFYDVPSVVSSDHTPCVLLGTATF